MTLQETISFELTEVRAVVFECESCGARVSVAPEKIEKPPTKCPCDHAWDWNVGTGFNSTESPFRGFLLSLAKLRGLPKGKFGCRILLEIEKLATPSASQRSEQVP